MNFLCINFIYIIISVHWNFYALFCLNCTVRNTCGRVYTSDIFIWTCKSTQLSFEISHLEFTRCTHVHVNWATMEPKIRVIEAAIREKVSTTLHSQSSLFLLVFQLSFQLFYCLFILSSWYFSFISCFH